MINRLQSALLLLIIPLTGAGCQLPWRAEESKYVDPVLSMNINHQELVDYLNSQHHGLEAWRCTSTVMWVRLPNGLRQRLDGVIACQAPQYFRLTAENLIADADLGSNDKRCWMYVRPGDPAVLTWRHEDTILLQQMPTGMPYIDPSWLMLVLGIKPLNPDDYELSRAPAGTQELWLTAIESSPTGRPLRRVIKVDAVRGVIREHAVYDSEAHPIVRAQLSHHKSYNGHRIPGSVKLEFPQMDSEISLTFKTIETNPHLSEELWKLPDRNMQVVDLGNMIRNRMATQQPGSPRTADQKSRSQQARLQPPDFDTPIQSAFSPSTTVIDGTPNADQTIREPEWDAPVSHSRTVTPPRPVFDQPPTQSGTRRRSFWQFWKR